MARYKAMFPGQQLGRETGFESSSSCKDVDAGISDGHWPLFYWMCDMCCINHLFSIGWMEIEQLAAPQTAK